MIKRAKNEFFCHFLDSGLLDQLDTADCVINSLNDLLGPIFYVCEFPIPSDSFNQLQALQGNLVIIILHPVHILSPYLCSSHNFLLSWYKICDL